jgi:hypothetical protein
MENITKFNNLYYSPNISRVIKKKRTRWTGHVARMVEMLNAYKVLVQNLEVKTTS